MSEDRAMCLLLNAVDFICDLQGYNFENNKKEVFKLLSDVLGITVEEFKILEELW